MIVLDPQLQVSLPAGQGTAEETERPEVEAMPPPGASTRSQLGGETMDQDPSTGGVGSRRGLALGGTVEGEEAQTARLGYGGVELDPTEILLPLPPQRARSTVAPGETRRPRAHGRDDMQIALVFDIVEAVAGSGEEVAPPKLYRGRRCDQELRTTPNHQAGTIAGTTTCDKGTMGLFGGDAHLDTDRISNAEREPHSPAAASAKTASMASIRSEGR